MTLNEFMTTEKISNADMATSLRERDPSLRVTPDWIRKVRNKTKGPSRRLAHAISALAKGRVSIEELTSIGISPVPVDGEAA